MSPPQTSTHDAFPVGTWELDQTHSQVGFAVRAVGTFRGSFETIDATLTVSDQFLCPLRGRDASVKMVASEPVTPSPSWS